MSITSERSTIVDGARGVGGGAVGEEAERGEVEHRETDAERRALEHAPPRVPDPPWTEPSYPFREKYPGQRY